jgi:DNA modification methylase
MSAWPADKVERRAVAGLIPYARNARTHSAEQIAQLAASIREWGWTVPILVDEAGGLIAGHGRVLAAQQLGLAEVPTMVARGWSAAQKRAYILADNKLALNAGWDMEMLRGEIADLQGLGADLSLMGFAPDEVASILVDPNAGLTDPDEVPEAPANPMSVLGDVWRLGRHRLACGDCTDADAVKAALGGTKPHLMVTDPPYGVEYDPDWRRRAGLNGTGAAHGKVQNDDRVDWREAWALFPGDVAYVWHASLFGGTVAEGLAAVGLHLRSQIIWQKQQMVIGRGDYHWMHESCWYAVRKGAKGHWAGDRKQTTVWQIDKPVKSETGHSTQKPVECMRRPMENNSKAGDAVYEPFCGSGTTIIAGEMTERSVFALEISPAYVDVAVLRWQAFTGLQATLEGDGRPYDEVAKARGL